MILEKIFRFLPSFKGKQRIARIIFRQQIKDSYDTIIRGKYKCSYKLPNLKEIIAFEIFINGIYENNHVKFISNCYLVMVY